MINNVENFINPEEMKGFDVLLDAIGGQYDSVAHSNALCALKNIYFTENGFPEMVLCHTYQFGILRKTSICLLHYLR